MPVPLLPAVFALATVLCLASGLWLLLHLTALTAMLKGNADIVASPKAPRAARSDVRVALAVFLVSLACVIGIQLAAIAS